MLKKINLRGTIRFHERNAAGGPSKARTLQGIPYDSRAVIDSNTANSAAVKVLGAVTGLGPKKLGQRLDDAARKGLAKNPGSKTEYLAAKSATDVKVAAKEQLDNIQSIKDELKNVAGNTQLSTNDRNDKIEEVGKRFTSAVEQYQKFRSANSNLLADSKWDAPTNKDGSNITENDTKQFAQANLASGATAMNDSFDFDGSVDQARTNADVQGTISIASEGLIAFAATRPEVQALIGTAIASLESSPVAALLDMIQNSEAVASALRGLPDAHNFITKKLHNLDGLSPQDVARIGAKLEIFSTGAGGISSTTMKV